MKHFDYKTGLQFNNSFLVVEKYCYSYKTVNFYDLDYWPIKPLSNFVLQNRFFSATDIAQENNKSKYMYSSYGGAFDGAGSCRFGKDFNNNVTIFGVDNSLSSILIILRITF